MGFGKQKEEYDYFGGFLVCAHAGSTAAQYLHSALSDFSVALLPQHVKEMHSIENDADSDKHEMTSRLAHEFITPIEREDIAALSQQLDNIVDSVEDVIRRIYMFNVSALRTETLAFTELIVSCCSAVEKLVEEFRFFKKSKTIHHSIIAVNTLESEGDKLHADAMRRLFTEETDTRTLLVWMTIFESLENCLDACEDAADIIESVIMKNT
ncbi:MAG: DUF47 family protein [Ruthenibacterium sp.]